MRLPADSAIQSTDNSFAYGFRPRRTPPGGDMPRRGSIAMNSSSPIRLDILVISRPRYRRQSPT